MFFELANYCKVRIVYNATVLHRQNVHNVIRTSRSVCGAILTSIVGQKMNHNNVKIGRFYCGPQFSKMSIEENKNVRNQGKRLKLILDI